MFFINRRLVILTIQSFWAPGATANNVNLIRYSDILLWAAEAEVETGGDLDKAREYVNQSKSKSCRLFRLGEK